MSTAIADGGSVPHARTGESVKVLRSPGAPSMLSTDPETANVVAFADSARHSDALTHSVTSKAIPPVRFPPPSPPPPSRLVKGIVAVGRRAGDGLALKLTAMWVAELWRYPVKGLKG